MCSLKLHCFRCTQQQAWQQVSGRYARQSCCTYAQFVLPSRPPSRRHPRPPPRRNFSCHTAAAAAAGPVAARPDANVTARRA